MTPTESAAAGVPRFADPPAPSNVNVGGAERVVSAVAGGLLAAYGLSRRSLPGLVVAGLGGALASRGVRGHCPAYGALGVSTAAAPAPIEIVQSVSVTAPRPEVYTFWRQLENLPRFMEHLRSVEALSETRSRWTARGPGPLPDVTWEAEIVEDVENERVVWQSLPGADVDNAGHVRFADGPRGLTEVHARIAYRPPAGPLGAAVAAWLDPVLGSAVRQDIARFKHVIEAGEVPRADPTVKGA
ncbi:MAG TPA: SRPBCC family protein [Rubricoccaceae bacterium]